MRSQLILSRTTTMMSQIRSHFVFNLLNAISGMCKYDPEKADDTIVRFARYLRNNIDIMEDDGVGFDMQELSKEKSVGLKNIRFRLRHLVNGTLDIASEEGKGTIATITIPKKEDESCT